MKVLVILSIIVLASTEEYLDHCPNTEDLFADTTRIPDSALSPTVLALRQGEEVTCSDEALVFTVPLTDPEGGVPLVTEVKLVANALVKFAYTSPNSADFTILPSDKLTVGANKFRIRGDPIKMSSLKIIMEELYNSDDTEFKASGLEIQGCEQQIIHDVSELASDSEWDGEDLNWD